MTAGETVDSPERRQSGQYGPALPAAFSERRNPQTRSKGKHPQWSPRGGEDEIPTRTYLPVMTHSNDQGTMSVECACGKKCKNLHGSRIHQAKMESRWCSAQEKHLVRRKRNQAGNTSTVPGTSVHLKLQAKVNRQTD